ncbi:hypothetical protein LINGRAHAP2_LOCUS7063 [Linum grandiflorum]
MYNSNGIPVDGRAGSTFCRAPFVAEAAALLAAVQLAGNTTHPTLILSDCSPLIASLNVAPHLWPWEGASLIAAITDLLSRYHWVEVQQCSKSVLKAADFIAKKARSGVLEPNWLSSL